MEKPNGSFWPTQYNPAEYWLGAGLPKRASQRGVIQPSSVFQQFGLSLFSWQKQGSDKTEVGKTSWGPERAHCDFSQSHIVKGLIEAISARNLQYNSSILHPLSVLRRFILITPL